MTATTNHLHLKGIGCPGPQRQLSRVGEGNFLAARPPARAPGAQKPGQVGARARNEQNGTGGGGQLRHWEEQRALGPWLPNLAFGAGRWPVQAWVWLWLQGPATQLCNPMEAILPGSSVHGILQARILEWVAISFSRCVCVCVCVYAVSEKNEILSYIIFIKITPK